MSLFDVRFFGFCQRLHMKIQETRYIFNLVPATGNSRSTRVIHGLLNTRPYMSHFEGQN